MRSAWWWGTPQWLEYLAEYAKTRPECLKEWKSSPLACDHDFSEYVDEPASAWERTEHQSQVIDLRTHKWSDVRKSYRGIINQARSCFSLTESMSIRPFEMTHLEAFGEVRSLETFKIQERWIASGHAMAVCAYESITEFWSSIPPVACALWIIYKGNAYYASGPSRKPNVQHLVIWRSLELLRERGVELVELGQIDGGTEKERNIGKFKAGFGGDAKPFTIVRRKS